MSEPARTDVVVFGGGVAGLWTRCVLAKRGYSVVLLDNAPLGTGQTLASQGIIHAGIKYALSGKAGRASRVMADAAQLWQGAMSGESDVDLRGLHILADSMHLWTREEKASKLAAWGASKAMRSGVRKIALADRPPLFVDAPDAIDLYEVDEPVIDPADLLSRLVQEGHGACIGIDPHDTPRIRTVEHGVQVDASVGSNEPLSIVAQRVVFCAGAGNEQLLSSIGEDSGLAQRRPLHMVVVRNAPAAMYGHCVRMSDVPLFTITTTASDDGQAWLVGGELAERGVERSQEEQINAARQELAQGLPWIDLSACAFSTFRVDRAEGRTPGGKRPDEPVVTELNKIVGAWPTKLVLAPVLADRIATLFERDDVPRTVGDAIEHAESIAVGMRPWEGQGVK
jgi:glycine/D-amino acid oxidase-like deaminating enzyme